MSSPNDRVLAQFIKPFNPLRDGSGLGVQFVAVVGKARQMIGAGPDERRAEEKLIEADDAYKRHMERVERDMYMQVPWPPEDAIERCVARYIRSRPKLAPLKGAAWHQVIDEALRILIHLSAEIEKRGFRRSLETPGDARHLLEPFIGALFIDFDEGEKHLWAEYLYRKKPSLRPFFLSSELYDELPSALKWSMSPNRWYADISHVTDASTEAMALEVREHLARLRIEAQQRGSAEKRWGDDVGQVPGYTLRPRGYDPLPKERRGRPRGSSSKPTHSRRYKHKVIIDGLTWPDIAMKPREERALLRVRYIESDPPVLHPAKNFDDRVRYWRRELRLPAD